MLKLFVYDGLIKVALALCFRTPSSTSTSMSLPNSVPSTPSSPVTERLPVDLMDILSGLSAAEAVDFIVDATVPWIAAYPSIVRRK